MRQGRPKKLNNPVTVSIVLEHDKLNDLDKMRENFSRGEYIHILTISDNLKTQKILKLKMDLKTKEETIIKLTSQSNISFIQGFQKTIHSHFKNQFKEILRDMPKTTKTFWAEKIGCSISELHNYL